MLFAFFGLSLIGWFIFCAGSIAITILEELERPGWSGIVLGLMVGGLYYAGVPFVTWVPAHLGLCALFLGVYILIGSVWGLLIRWAMIEANRYREKVMEAKLEFCTHFKITGDVIPESFLTSWADKLNQRGLATPPNVTQHKLRILSWMGYWPWSMFWFVVKDPIRRMFRFLYNRLRKTAQAISDRITGTARQEVERATKYVAEQKEKETAEKEAALRAIYEIQTRRDEEFDLRPTKR